MKQTHKKALLAAALLSAALAGTVALLSPLWVQHKEMREQEAMLMRIQDRAGEDQETEAAFVAEPDTEPPMDIAALEEFPEGESTEACFPEPETTIILENAVEKPIEKPIEKPREGAEIGVLSIPKIDAKLPVTAGVSEEQLKISEGWVRQTDVIGSKGNAVIAGHRSYTYGRHFNRLEELETGDKIVFTSSDGDTMSFFVSEILTAEPDDPAVFALPQDGGAQLTLYTCTPIRIATHRLIVRALRSEE